MTESTKQSPQDAKKRIESGKGNPEVLQSKERRKSNTHTLWIKKAGKGQPGRQSEAAGGCTRLYHGTPQGGWAGGATRGLITWAMEATSLDRVVAVMIAIESA